MIRVNLDKMLWERHMKLSELSEKSGISLTNLSLLKTGKGRAIRFTTLNKLCKVLECVPGDILECSDLYISCFVFAIFSA